MTGTYATVPADKLASWAVANSLTLADVVANAADYLDNYLMNVGVGVDTGIEITSIVYDPTTEKAKITVEATDPNDEQFGLPRLKELIRAHSHESMETLTTIIGEAVSAHYVGDHPPDDLTILAARRLACRGPLAFTIRTRAFAIGWRFS